MPTSSSTRTDGRTTRRSPAVLAAGAVLVVCAAAAGGTGVSWALAANDESIAYASERERAIESGSQAVINFNTLDFRSVDQGLKRWVDSSSGALRDEVERGRAANAKRIAEARTVTTAEVLDVGLTELDQRAGKARMIAVVKVVVTKEGAQPAEKRSRYQAELTREGDQWKLSALGPVPVG